MDKMYIVMYWGASDEDGEHKHGRMQLAFKTEEDALSHILDIEGIKECVIGSNQYWYESKGESVDNYGRKSIVSLELLECELR